MYNNYYPYSYPKQPSIFSNFKRMNLSHILDGTQKALSVINQAIPVIYQIKPLINNAKTAFKVVNAIKKDSNFEETKKEIIKENNLYSSNNSPTYFL